MANRDPETRSALRYIMDQPMDKAFVRIPERVSDKWGGRVAMTGLFNTEQMEPEDFVETDPLTGEKVERPFANVETYSSYKEFSNRFGEMAKKQSDPDMPNFLDEARKRNKIIFLGEEESEQTIQKLRRGEVPQVLKQTEQLMESFKLRTGIRQNRERSEIAQEKQSSLNLMGAVQQAVKLTATQPLAVTNELTGERIPGYPDFESVEKNWENFKMLMEDYKEDVWKAKEEGEMLSQITMDLWGVADNTTVQVAELATNSALQALKVAPEVTSESMEGWWNALEKGRRGFDGLVAELNNSIEPGKKWDEITEKIIKNDARAQRINVGLATEEDLKLKDDEGNVWETLDEEEAMGFLGGGSLTIARQIKMAERTSPTVNTALDIGTSPMRAASGLLVGMMGVMDIAGEALGYITGDEGFSNAISTSEIAENWMTSDSADLFGLAAISATDQVLVTEGLYKNPFKRAKAKRAIADALEEVEKIDPDSLSEAQRLFETKLDEKVSKRLSETAGYVSNLMDDMTAGEQTTLWNELVKLEEAAKEKEVQLGEARLNTMDAAKIDAEANLWRIDHSEWEKPRVVEAGDIKSAKLRGLQEAGAAGLEIRPSRFDLDISGDVLGNIEQAREAGRVEKGLPRAKQLIRDKADRIEAVGKLAKKYEGIGKLQDIIAENAPGISEGEALSMSVALERYSQNPETAPQKFRRLMQENYERSGNVLTQITRKITQNILDNKEKFSDKTVEAVRRIRTEDPKINRAVRDANRNVNRKKSPDSASTVVEEATSYSHKIDYSGDQLSDSLLLDETVTGQQRAAYEFMDEVAQGTGEVLHSDSLRARHISSVVDEFLYPEQAAGVKHDMMNAIRRGASELNDMDFSARPELASDVARKVLDKIAPFLEQGTKEKLVNYAASRMVNEDLSVRTGARVPIDDAGSGDIKSRINEVTPVPDQPNAVAGRLKPFMDILQSLRKGGLENLVPSGELSNLRQMDIADVTGIVTDELRNLKKNRNLPDDVTGSLVPEEVQMKNTAEGLAHVLTGDGEVAQKIGNVMQSVSDKYVQEGFQPLDLARNFPDRVASGIFKEVQSEAVARELTNEFVEQSPKTEQQMFEFFQSADEVDFPGNAVDSMAKDIARRVSGREPYDPTEMSIVEYVREGMPEDVTPNYPTMDAGTRKVKKTMEINESGSTFGLRRESEIQGTKALVRENVGNKAHLRAGLLDKMEEILAGEKISNGKHMMITRAFKDHPELGKTLENVDGPMAQKFVGGLIESGQAYLIPEMRKQGILEDGKINWDEMLKRRREDSGGGNLPPQEAKTYASLLMSGLGKQQALRLTREGFALRLADEFDSRINGYQTLAKLQEIKEANKDFPVAIGTLGSLEQRLRRFITEEYLDMSDDAIQRADAVKRKFDSIDEIIDDYDLPKEIKQQLKGEIKDLDRETALEWMDDMIEESDRLHPGDVHDFVQRFFDKDITELTKQEIGETVEFIKSAGRDEYMSRHSSMPEAPEAMARKTLNESLEDASQNFDNMNKLQRAKYDSVKPDELDVSQARRTDEGDGGGRGGDGEGGGTGDGEAEPLNDPEELAGEKETEVDVGNMTRVVDATIRTVQSAIERFGQVGRAINNLISSTKQLQLRLSRKYISEVKANIDLMKDAGIYKSEIMENWWDSLDGSTDKPMQQALEDGRRLARQAGGEEGVRAFNEAREAFDQIRKKRGQELAEVGHTVKRVDEHGNVTNEPFQPRENWMPRVMHPDLEFRPDTIAQVRKLLAEEMPEAKVENIIQSMVDRTGDVRKSSSTDFSRIFEDFKQQLFVKDPETALVHWAKETARRQAELEILGPDMVELYGVDGNGGLMDVLKDRHGENAFNHVDKLVDTAMRGSRNTGMLSQGIANFSRAMRKILAAQYLQQAFIPNSAQWLFGGILASDTARAIPKALKKSFENPVIDNKGTTFHQGIIESGYSGRQWQRQAMQSLDRGNMLDTYVEFSLLPFKYTELFTRHMSGAIGIENFKYLLRELKTEIDNGATRKNPTPRAELLMEKMRENGIKDGLKFGRGGAFEKTELNVWEIAERGHLTDIERTLVVNKWNSRTNFSADPWKLPKGWSTEIGKIAGFLRTFMVNWGKLIKDTVAKPYYQRLRTTAKGSRLKAAAMTAPGVFGTTAAFATAGIPIGSLFWNIRAMLNGRESEMYNDGISTYLAEVGGLGIVTSMLDQLEWGKNVFEIVGGLPAQEISKLQKVGVDGDFKDFFEYMMERGFASLPHFGKLIEQRAFRGTDERWESHTFAENFFAVPGPYGSEPWLGNPRSHEFEGKPNNVSNVRNKIRWMLNTMFEGVTGIDVPEAGVSGGKEKTPEPAISTEQQRAIDTLFGRE